MKQEKKICIRITARRIAGAVLVAATVVNLIIVGAVSAVTPPPSTMTPTMTVSASTNGEALTLPPRVTDTLTPSATPTDTPTPTSTSTQTPSATSTYTFTPTYTLTPSLVPCTPQYSWPIYLVERGDRLFSIALATGSTVNEIMLANCLVSDLIFPGQLLYVPRLPIITPTFTPTVTLTYTSPAPIDTSTDFQNPSGISCYLYRVDFSVTAYDPEGITSLVVLLYDQNHRLLDQLLMTPDGSTYFASGSSGQYPVTDITNYYFSAVDNLGNTTTSPAQDGRTISCPLG